MQKQKIYLETTLFNHYFDEDRGLAHTSTVALFKKIEAGKYEAFTSSYTLDEIAKAPAEKRDKMVGLLSKYNIFVLTYHSEADSLADIYVSENVIPLKYRTDGLHIAVAAVNNMDMIVSMNLQHIVKPKTKLATGSINSQNGYRAVGIFNPMELLENENR